LTFHTDIIIMQVLIKLEIYFPEYSYSKT